MNIRPATIKAFEQIYNIGKDTLEFKVSDREKFMYADEFRWSITHPNGVFLVAEEKQKIIGFIYVNSDDLEKPYKHKYACLIYIAVLPEFRKKGVATKLYSQCQKRLKKLGITHLYAWANAENESAIIKFLEKQGFTRGHKYIWMDKKLT